MNRNTPLSIVSNANFLISIVLVVLFYQLATLIQIPYGQSMVVIKGATQQFQCNDPSKPLTDWRDVSLPHWEKGIEDTLHCMRMRTTLSREQLSIAQGPAKLMLSALSGLGRIWLNGEKIDEVIHATSERRVLWLRPYSVVIPSHLIRDTNLLVFDYYNYQPILQIGQLQIGSEPLIEDKMRQVTFISKTTNEGSTVLFGIIGAFLISFSLLYPRERLMGLAGSAMFCWALFINMQMMIEVPSDYYVIWQAIQYVTIAWAIFSFIDFYKIISEIKSNPLLMRLRTIYALSGFVLCMIFGSESIYYLDTYWVGGMVVYMTYILAYCFWQRHLLRKSEGQLLALQSSISLVLILHDYLINTGTMELVWNDYSAFIPDLLAEEIYLMQFGIANLLVVMGVIVFNRYREAQSYEQAEATRIGTALRHSATRLRDVMQKQQDLNNIRLIQSERERLLMEIHDGVGSQLIAGMLLAKKQDLSHETILDMFQVCLDDVKVIIDCISLGQPANAAVMIGTLLDRQRQRLAGLGMSLNFIADQKKNASLLEISDAQCLHASRIVQECIANAIKYAQCSMITVSLRQYQDHLLIVVRDNGTGLAPAETIKLGRGLMNMRKRARLLSGQIRFLSKEDGFRVMLRFKNTTIEDFMQAA